MLNSLMVSGLVMFGSIDKVNENFATVEYTFNGKIQYLDISLEGAPCKPVEGMYVLFSNKTIVKCMLSNLEKVKRLRENIGAGQTCHF